MVCRMIQVGTGGFGAAWCRRFLPPNVKDGLIEVVAAADKNPEALENAREGLGLPPEKCYTDVKRALAENRADFCAIVVPPAFHEEIVDLALAHDLHILSEKPIADTLAASVRIAEKVRSAGRKMGVTMSHRFDQDKTTLRAECEGATLILNQRRIERFPYGPERQGDSVVEGTGEPVMLLEQPKWSNTWLVEKYVRWLAGGEPMETNVEANLQSVALVFAAIESSRSGQPIKVQEFLAKAGNGGK